MIVRDIISYESTVIILPKGLVNLQDLHRVVVLEIALEVASSLCFRFIAAFYELMEKAMAPNSSTLAWKIPWTEEPCRLQSMGSLRVGHD